MYRVAIDMVRVIARIGLELARWALDRFWELISVALLDKLFAPHPFSSLAVQGTWSLDPFPKMTSTLAHVILVGLRSCLPISWGMH